MPDLFDHEMERAVLSIIATESSTSVPDARLLLEGSRLTPEDFHLPDHAQIFEVSRRLLFLRGLPVDPLSVKAELQRREPLDALLSTIWSDERFHLSTSLPGYSKHLRQLALRRRLVSQARHLVGRASDLGQDPESVLAEVTGQLAGLTGLTAGVRSLREIMGEIAHDLSEVQERGAQPVVPTGVGPLDGIIGGWQPTLNVVGALPGVGKSALFASTAHFNARRGTKVAVFSLEDEGSWLGWRILSHEASVTQFILRFRRMDGLQLSKVKHGFSKLHSYSDNILVVDGSENGMSPDEIVTASNDLIVNHGVGLILIDHAGEVNYDPRMELHDATGRAMSRFRGVANRHQVPVVVAAHLRRREGLGPENPPVASDFANSAGIERKARVAVGLFRDVGSDTLGMAVLKNTMGKTGRTEAEFVGAAAMVRAVEGEVEAA